MQRALQPAAFVMVPAVHVQHARQGRDQPLGRHVVDAHDAAGRVGEFAAAAMPHDFVAVAHLLDGQVEQRLGRSSALSLRNRCPVPCGTSVRLPCVSSSGSSPSTSSQQRPAVTMWNIITTFHGRHLNAPRRRQLGAAVKAAGEAQQMQGLADRIVRGRQVRCCACHGVVCATNICLDVQWFGRSAKY